MEKFLTYANELGSDASDDPQMAMFVAQALQFSKDAKPFPQRVPNSNKRI